MFRNEKNRSTPFPLAYNVLHVDIVCVCPMIFSFAGIFSLEHSTEQSEIIPNIKTYK